MKSNPTVSQLASGVGGRFVRRRRAALRAQWLGVCLTGAFAGLGNDGRAQALNQTSLKDPTDLSLEELVNIRVESVFAASKYAQKVTQAPASVSIMTADEIQKFGYRSIGDVLHATRGFYVSNDRNYSYPGSQGFQRPGDFNTRYLVLVDGHRMNDNIFGATSVGTDSVLDIDLIDRVEVIRGPSSSIYGNNAFLGVINIVTKTARDFHGAEGSFEVGSFGTAKGRFSFGKKFSNNLEWVLSASYYRSDGQAELYYPEFDQRLSSAPRARNNGVARNSDGETSRQVFTSVSYRDFTLTGLYSLRIKDVPTAPFGAFFGSEPSQTKDERDYVELKYVHQIGENTEVSGRFSYDVFPHIGRFPYDYGTSNQPADIVNDYDGDFGDWLTMEIQLKRRLFDRHTVIFGVAAREDLTQHLFNYDTANTTFIEDRRHGRSLGAFGQLETVLRPNLRLNAGLHFDYFDTFGGTLNPRLAAIYNPWDKTTVKLVYGRAFRAPNDYELYYGSPSFGQVPSPNLKPEIIRTYEIIFEQYLPAHLRFSASGYEYRITNLISQAPEAGTGLLIFGNLNRVEAKGMEFELEGKYPGGLLARASYTVQRTNDSDSGDELSNSPRHLIKGNLAVPICRGKGFAGLELQYQSSVKTLSGGDADDFLIGNLTLSSKEIVKGWDASAGVYNFLATRYSTPGSGGHLQDAIPQDGRSFRLKLTRKF